MTAPALPSKPLSSGRHRVGAGLSVSFTLRGEHLQADWRPRLPTKREMRRVADRYRVARDAFLSELGQRIVVVEVQP